MLKIFAICLIFAVLRNAEALGKVVWSVNAGGDSHTDSFGIYYSRDNLRVGTASDYGKALMIQRVSTVNFALLNLMIFFLIQIIFAARHDSLPNRALSYGHIWL